MKKSHTLWLLGGGALVLYFLSQQQASAGQGQQGQGQLPSSGGGGYGGGYQQSGMGAPRPQFRR